MLDDFNFHRGLGLKLYNFRVRYSENQTLFWIGISKQLMSKIVHSLGQ